MFRKEKRSRKQTTWTMRLRQRCVAAESRRAQTTLGKAERSTPSRKFPRLRATQLQPTLRGISALMSPLLNFFYSVRALSECARHNPTRNSVPFVACQRAQKKIKFNRSCHLRREGKGRLNERKEITLQRAT